MVQRRNLCSISGREPTYNHAEKIWTVFQWNLFFRVVIKNTVTFQQFSKPATRTEVLINITKAIIVQQGAGLHLVLYFVVLMYATRCEHGAYTA